MILKICTAPIIMSWDFRKNKAVLLKSFLNFELPLLSQAEIFAKIKRFVAVIWNLNCPYHHELNFDKNMADFMKSLENPDCPYYPGLKFPQKWSGFVEMIWKFDMPLHHKVAFLQKYGRFDDWTGPIIAG